ncbi:Signal_recognition particle [Hexamita inflata]|uniref:Signal recognition particle subunit SRP68 n=2 Tax=Hexamita inflata TaxID=28002 RepID=A0AA86NKQ8_9EUKA|nr:Signal recognition particle [Hexamita inflata]
MHLNLDLTSYIHNLRGANGFYSSEFQRYAHYIASLMPHLRKISAPALRLQAAKHPFVFQADFLKRDDYGLTIIQNELAQLIILEAERAFSNAGQLQKFLQSNDPKLMNLNFQKLRRRQFLDLKRALERAATLQLTTKQFGSESLQIQTDYYHSFINANVQQEQDQYFEAANSFSAACEALVLLKSAQVEQEAIEALLNDCQERLNHCVFMAKAYAGDDAEILKQIDLDCEQERQNIRDKYINLQKNKDDIEVKQEVVKIFQTETQKIVELVIPRGAISRKLKVFSDNPILSQDLTSDYSKIEKQMKVEYDEIETVFVPGVFSRPKQNKSDYCTKEFKNISQRIELLKKLLNLTQSYLDKPKPIDHSRLQHFNSIIKSELNVNLTKYYKINVQNYMFGLVNGKYSKKNYNVQQAIEYLLCKELKQDAVNQRVVSQLASQNVSETVRQYIVIYYVQLLEQMKKKPETFKILDGEKEVNYQIDVFYQVPVQPQGQQPKTGKPPVQEFTTKVDALKQLQLFAAQQQQVLTHLLYVLQKPCGEFFTKITLKDVIEASLDVLQRRQNIKVEDKGEQGVIAPIMPGPAFFDVLPDELEFDDILFDCAGRQKEVIVKEEPKKKFGLFK